MNDDEFDEMVRAQHRQFTADMARVLDSRPVPVHVSKRYRVTGVLSAMLGRVQPAWGVSGLRAGAALVVSGLAVLAFAALPVQPSGPVAMPEADAPSQGEVIQPGANSGPRAVVTPGVGKLRLPVLFRPDSADLTPGARAAIIQLVRGIRPTDRIVVVGHTARVGNPESARSFSIQRAQAVADLLVDLGIAGTRVTVGGVGFDQSPPGDDTRSRRVDVDVVAPD